MTARDTVAATTPIAMHAVAGHMLDYRLPAPGAIEAPRAYSNAPAHLVVKTLAPGAWVDSIHVDQTDTSPLDRPAGYERVSWFGRLPDTGVRVEIRTVRLTATPAAPSPAPLGPQLVSLPGGVA